MVARFNTARSSWTLASISLTMGRGKWLWYPLDRELWPIFEGPCRSIRSVLRCDNCRALYGCAQPNFLVLADCPPYRFVRTGGIPMHKDGWSSTRWR
jgi:hypothetical protein